jgi:hypothetical protein
LQQQGIEVLFHPFVGSIAELLATRGHEFDVIIVSRHYIAAKHIDTVRQFAPQALLVFDTVDLHSCARSAWPSSRAMRSVAPRRGQSAMRSWR